MKRTVLKAGVLGVLAASLFGCSATPPTQTAQSPAASSQAPVVEIPMQATEQELVAPQNLGNGQEVQQYAWRGGRRYRFRRVIITGVPYYVPYYYPTTYPYYVPYYNYYDPSYYYVPAYSAPYFGSRSIIVRYGRRGGGWRR